MEHVRVDEDTRAELNYIAENLRNIFVALKLIALVQVESMDLDTTAYSEELREAHEALKRV